jgi:hypothetical protein
MQHQHQKKISVFNLTLIENVTYFQLFSNILLKIKAKYVKLSFSLKLSVLVNTYVLLMTPDLGSILNTPYVNELIFTGDFQMYCSFTSIFLTFYFSNVRWAENVILLFSSFFRLLS